MLVASLAVNLLVFALAGGIRQFAGVTALIWLGSGAAVWLTAGAGTVLSNLAQQ